MNSSRKVDEHPSFSPTSGFSFFIQTQLAELCKSADLATLHKHLESLKWSRKDRKNILNELALSLLVNEKALPVSDHLKPLVPELVIRCEGLITDSEDKLRLLVTLSKLIHIYPHLVPFTSRYLLNTGGPFQLTNNSTPEQPPTKRKKADQKKESVSDEMILEACFNFLSCDLSEFSAVCDWSHVLTYLESSTTSRLAKWYAVETLAVLYGMDGPTRHKFVQKYFTDEQKVAQFLLKNRERLISLKSQVDLAEDIIMKSGETSPDDSRNTAGIILHTDLSDALVSICGVLLPRWLGTEQSPAVPSAPGTVCVPSMYDSLRDLAISVSSNRTVLLEGPVGSGKTSIVEYLAHLTGRDQQQLVKIQLGEQIDSKTLLGTYCCTEIPGQFVWRPGPLVNAVTLGQWLLLEDIDIAPMDVVTCLLPLMETGYLSVSAHSEKIKPAPGFQLFMTKRSHASGSGNRGLSSSSLLDKLVTKIVLKPLSHSELKQVITTLHPNLATVTDRLLDMYFTLSSGRHADDRSDATDDEMYSLMSFPGSRQLSTRDLLRWCKRIADDFVLSGKDPEIAVFQEALCCFCDCLAKPQHRRKLALAIGSKINISEEKCDYFCATYKPDIEITDDSIRVGRASLTRLQQSAKQSLGADAVRFAFTRQATCLLERIAVCVQQVEPVLLVGETGTGKTSIIQYLAKQTGRKLTVINMNQQSDSSDLLGGHKPVVLDHIILPIRQQFEDAFSKTFSRKQNSAFLGHIHSCFIEKRWKDLLALMDHSITAALKKDKHKDDWVDLRVKHKAVSKQVDYSENALAFSFIEGALVKAIRGGDWVLLDEINLASAETLDCLCGLLESATGSVVLVERGDSKPVLRHPDFRLFACMNPATDVGKKDLPGGVRSRFAEFYVDELTSKPDLRLMVSAYLTPLALRVTAISGIVEFYLAARKAASTSLVDSNGRRPNYSLRTLCRALSYAATNPGGSVLKSLCEAFSMSFLTQLDRSSHHIVIKLIIQHILDDESRQSVLKSTMPSPQDRHCKKFEGYWVTCGRKKAIIDSSYILTTSVKANLRDLARAVSCKLHPVLLQGETSVGKTSMIEYLAKATGNKCVRINNHEHTDIQEYIGSYVADHKGKLVFQDGILVDAMRRGYWIILDELNLAPSDVLEALNRLLDENRELFIPETLQTVKAHANFLLFATQNPPGHYGGRKVLSRAFRNRFIELHFGEIPHAELETILHKRCCLPLTAAKKMVKVMVDLQLLRRSSGLFAGKQGYISLRDLFRWGERYRQNAKEITQDFYDWDQALADQGFLLLAGRVRKQSEEKTIAEVIEKHFRRKVDPRVIFSRDSEYVTQFMDKLGVLEPNAKETFKHIVWTYNLTRLATLVGQCIKYYEPVLMIGDTGCGKTTICQYFAKLSQQQLYSVNCHMHTESSHFLGGLRPARHETDSDKLFEWKDGPLVLAMRHGGMFLIDEISLADDSVLERLNSVLESGRKLVLAEKGGQIETLCSSKAFRILATMNPSGDFGKKELSPALRNRFTEIWCPQTTELNDYKLIVEHNVEPGLSLPLITPDIVSDSITDGEAAMETDSSEMEAAKSSGFGMAIQRFIEWFKNQAFGRRYTVSVRDVLAWVGFVNSCSGLISPEQSFIHGACLVFLDSFSAVNGGTETRQACLDYLKSQLITHRTSESTSNEMTTDWICDDEAEIEEGKFHVGPFSIPTGPRPASDPLYTLSADRTRSNVIRLLRGLQLNKPILLEGSPGVGKTSLVSAIGKASGHHVVRINLSEQTDLSDLFGADLPVEGGAGGQFEWKDGLFLQALKSGHWILLDEMNLASQSVLEGLNSCFDHRSEIYVPELGKTFTIRHEDVKIFACQNPLLQGGGRKGLPQSFLNRFTQVYCEELNSKDQEFITKSLYPQIPEEMVKYMVEISRQMTARRIPGEHNLRDIFRWCFLITSSQTPDTYDIGQHFALLYVQPLRYSDSLCDQAYQIYRDVTGRDARHDIDTPRNFAVTHEHVLIGSALMKRSNQTSTPDQLSPNSNTSHLQILPGQLAVLESLAICLSHGFMAILDGVESSCKSSLVRILGSLLDQTVLVLPVHSSMDTTDLLGGFEQADVMRHIEELCNKIFGVVQSYLKLQLCGVSTSRETQKLSKLMYRLHHSSSASERLSACHSLLSLLPTPPASLLADHDKLRAALPDKSSATANSTMSGTFEWVDSVLVRAVRDGHWLVIDNAHLCSASVLDRLNALLEPNGELTITERGIINMGDDSGCVTIQPHPNFRLILTVDHRQGDLSRAMKNRGVVISTSACVPNTSLSEEPLDISQMFSSLSLPISPRNLLSDHQRSSEIKGFRQPVKLLYHRARLCADYMSRGFSVAQALKASLCVYGAELKKKRGDSEPVDEDMEIEEIESTGATGGSPTSYVASNSGVQEFSLHPVASTIERYLIALNDAAKDLSQTDPSSLLLQFYTEAASLHNLALLAAWPTESLFSTDDKSFVLEHIATLAEQLNALPFYTHDTSQPALFNLRLQMLVSALVCEIKHRPVNSWVGISLRYNNDEIDEKRLPHPAVEAFWTLALSLLSDSPSRSRLAALPPEEALRVVEALRRAVMSDGLAMLVTAWRKATKVLECSGFLPLPDDPDTSDELSENIDFISLELEAELEASNLFCDVIHSMPHRPPVNCAPDSEQPPLESGMKPVSSRMDVAVRCRNLLDELNYTRNPDTSLGEVVTSMKQSNDKSLLESLIQADWAILSPDSTTDSLRSLLPLLILPPPTVPNPYHVMMWPLDHLLLVRRMASRFLRGDSKSSDMPSLKDVLVLAPAALSLKLALLRACQSEQGCDWSEMDLKVEIFSSLSQSLPLTGAQAHLYPDSRPVRPDSPCAALLLFSNILSTSAPDLDKTEDKGKSTHWAAAPLGSFDSRVNQLRRLITDGWNNFEELSNAHSFQLYEWTGSWSKQLQAKMTPEIEQILPKQLKELRDKHELYQQEAEFQWRQLHPRDLADMPYLGVQSLVHLSLYHSLLTAPGGVLDPVVQITNQLRMIDDQLARLDRELDLRQRVQYLLCGVPELSTRDPYIAALISERKALKSKRPELAALASTRPYNQQFEKLVHLAQTFIKSTLNNSTSSIMTKLRLALETTPTLAKICLHAANNSPLCRHKSRSATTDTKKVGTMVNVVLSSCRTYLSKLESEFHLYADCIQAHVQALKMLCYSLSKSHQIHNLASKIFKDRSVKKCPELLYSLCLPSMYTLAETGMKSPFMLNKFRHMQLLAITLQNEAHHSFSLTVRLQDSLNSIFCQLTSWWREQQEKQEHDQQVKDSLYSIKSHGEEPLTDDQELAKMIQENFPKFHHKFDDLTTKDELKSDKPEPVEEPKQNPTKSSPRVNITDLWEASRLHASAILSLSSTSWFSRPASGSALIRTRRVDGLRRLYRTLSDFVNSKHNNLDGDLVELRTSRLLPLYLLNARLLERECTGTLNAEAPVIQSGASSKARGSPYDCRRDTPPYDIYHDSNVHLAARCTDCLVKTRSRISELLVMWPEHPHLEDIITLITRIESFPLTAPVMQFCTGLDTLLAKLQEWQSNAAKHVSVQTEMTEVTDIVILYRKTELDGWKDILNMTAYRTRVRAAKWWAYMYAAVSPYLSSDPTLELPDPAEIISTSLKLLETAPLGEFHFRLELVLVMALHLQAVSDRAAQAKVNTEAEVNTAAAERLAHSLAGIWDFYSRFDATITDTITKRRGAIEKELKEFVKISRWKDQNYYSVQASVEKSHKALAKHITEFQKVLAHPARDYLTEDVSANTPETTKEAELSLCVMLHSDNLQQAVSQPTEPMELTDDTMHELGLLPQIPHYNKRYLKITKSLVTKLDMVDAKSNRVHTLTGEIIETVKSLSGLTVIEGEDKVKQRKQAKNIDMRKRKALAELLKTLHDIGVSYRKGSRLLIKTVDSGPGFDWTTFKPFNAAISFAHLPSDNRIISTVVSTQDYMFKSTARRSVFISSAAKPHKELSPAEAEKLKGFSEQLMHLCRRHYGGVVSRSEEISRLGRVVQRLTRKGWSLPRADGSYSHVENLASVIQPDRRSTSLHQALAEISLSLPGLLELLEELLLTVDCAPQETQQLDEKFVQWYFKSGNRECLPVRLSSTIQCLREIASKLSELHVVRSQILPPVYEIDELNNALEHFEKLRNLMGNLYEHITTPYEGTKTWAVLDAVFTPSFSSFLMLLDGHIKKTDPLTVSSRPGSIVSLGSSASADGQEAKEEEDSEEACDRRETDFNKSAEQLIHLLLLGVQNLTSRTEELEPSDPDVLQPEHLTRHMFDIVSYIEVAKPDQVFKNLTDIWSHLATSRDESSRACTTLSRCIPLLEQYQSLLEYLITLAWRTLKASFKLLSVLYGVFTQIMNKGFCLPEEFSDEEEKGEGKTKDGMGLAEGKGAKDVSDQIEHEDDLDDAKRPEDRKEEEKDDEAPPANEEQGIEMSDDFDGAMEDAPQTEVNEDESDASSGDEDEMDDKMGDVGDSEVREKLDEKLWGEDEDEGAGNEKEQTEEEGAGAGDQKEELVAKNDNPDTTTDKSGDDKPEDESTDDQPVPEPNENEEEPPEYDPDEKADPYYEGAKPSKENEEDKEGEEEAEEIPENLNLDGEGADDDEDGVEENMEGMDGEGDIDEPDEPFEPEPVEETTLPEDIGETNEPEGEPDGEPAPEETPQVGEETNEPEAENPEDESAEDRAEAYGATETNEQPQQIQEEAALDKGGETESKEEEGAGQSEDTTQKEAGLGESMERAEKEVETTKENETLASSDDKRTLGETSRAYKRELHTAKLSERKERRRPTPKQELDANIYEHIQPHEEEEEWDEQVLDAATEEQLTEQQDVPDEEMDENKPPIKHLEAKEKEQPDDDTEVKLAEKLREKLKTHGGDESTSEKPEDMETDEAGGKDTEATIEEPTGHGLMESNIGTNIESINPLSEQELEALRETLERRVTDWSAVSAPEMPITTVEAREAWHNYETLTATLSHNLCEQLRLILEPTQATKLKGDYRTGKRLNMRKVIAYIASQFRKDKIWMRRSQPSKRDYQIALMIDDSSSMLDNHSKQLAFESLACVANALNHLQVGELAVASFGEEVNIIQDFSSVFNWDVGAQILQNFSFTQKKTRIAQMLKVMTTRFAACRQRLAVSSSRSDLSQLLLIVSDGRGLFLEGVETVNNAVRQALGSGIFIVFVIIDNPTSKNSILDIKIPVFKPDGVPEIKSYMDSFPFPFYIILRDINSLPDTLGDALRQWFELITMQH